MRARNHRGTPRVESDEPAGDEGLTARPTEAPPERDDEAVPHENVGGATATALGRDSGGQLAEDGSDDLAHLAEPESPPPPEVDAVHVRRELSGRGVRSRRGE